MKIILSFIIPCFNVRQYLPHLLAPILELLKEDCSFEIILIDDGSIDGTSEYIKALSAKFSTLNISTFHHEKNEGLSAVRNTGTRWAKGEYLWFVDSDDLLNLSSVKHILQILKLYHTDVVLTDICKFNDRDVQEGIDKIEKNDIVRYESRSFRPLRNVEADINSILHHYFQDSMMYSCTCIIKKTCFDGIVFPIGKKLEDVYTMPKAIANARSYYYLPEAAVYYRQRANSIMNTAKLDTFLDYGEAMADIVRYFRTVPLEENTRLQMLLSYSKILRWSLNDIIKHHLMSKEAWKSFRKNLDLYYKAMDIPVWQFSLKLSGHDSRRNITLTIFFISFPRVYALIKSKSINWLI